MFLLSRQGTVCLLLGLGLLLGLVGPSNALECYQCSEGHNNTDCSAPMSSDCGNSKSCLTGYNMEGQVVKLGCDLVDTEKCDDSIPTMKRCYCLTDKCNTGKDSAPGTGGGTGTKPGSGTGTNPEEKKPEEDKKPEATGGTSTTSAIFGLTVAAAGILMTAHSRAM